MLLLVPTTYSSLLRLREFRSLFASQVCTIGAGTVAGLALATLVNEATGSPLLTTLSLFGPTFAHLAGATALMSHADTSRPRRMLVAFRICAAVLILIQTAPITIPARFAVLVLAGLVQSVASGVGLGLLREVTPDNGYAPARSLFNIATGAAQIGGFGLGAVLLAAFSPQALFGIGVVLSVAAAVALGGMREHSIRVVARPGIRRTATINRWVGHHSDLRALLLALWIPNGLIVGCEALFVPYAGDRAGVMLVAAAGGMLAGDLTAGRLLTAAYRRRLVIPMRILLAAPYLVFFVTPDPWAIAPVVLIASTGFAASLGLQEALVAITPPEMVGQVQGLESSGRALLQGLSATMAGALAEVIDVHLAIAAMATLSLLATAQLARRMTTGLTAAATQGPTPV